MPLAQPRRLTATEQARIALWYEGAWFNPIARQSRRFGGGDWVATPGRLGMSIVKLTAESPPAALQGVNDSAGIRYEAVLDGLYISGSYGCGTWAAPDPSCSAATRYVNFVQIAPDHVRSTRIAGELFVPIEGLIYGSATFPTGQATPDVGDVLSEMAANAKRWRAQRQRRG
jgi:hypothetical protein